MSNSAEVPSNSLLSFIYGFRLDLSASCYLVSIPLLFWLISLFVTINLNKINYIIHLVLIPLVLLIDFSSIFIFQEWGITTNKRVLEYLSSPLEAIANSSGHPLLLYVFIFIFLAILEIFVFGKLILKTSSENFTKKRRIFVLIIFPILLFIGIRGSVFQMPLSESSAYYSNNQFCNKLAINKVWHLIYDLLKNDIDESKYNFYPDLFASEQVEKLISPSEKQLEISKNKRPNIVLIIVESFTFGVLDSNSKYGDLCPNFKKLKKEGVFFDNIYSSGLRSDQGIGSLFAGFPAQPEGSIIKNPDKYLFLPSFINTIKKADYSSQFMYGGESNFYNIKAFLLSQGIDKIIDKYDFSIGEREIKLGVTDKRLFDRAIHEWKSSKTPFFNSIFTQSTHPPYDTSVEGLSERASRPDKFASMMKITDKCLGEFIEKARKEVWYNNTLFIVVADHGTKDFNNYDWVTHFRNHIPMLMFGNVIKPEYYGLTIHKVGGHNDLSKTLLCQLGLPSNDFVFSKNLLDTLKPGFAFWTNDLYEGWVTDSTKLIINLRDKSIFSLDGKDDIDKLKLNSLCYIQSVVHYFKNKEIGKK